VTDEESTYGCYDDDAGKSCKIGYTFRCIFRCSEFRLQRSSITSLQPELSYLPVLDLQRTTRRPNKPGTRGGVQYKIMIVNAVALCKMLPLFLSITLVAQWIFVPSDAFTVSTGVLHSNDRFVKTRNYDPQCVQTTPASFRLLATREEENNLAPKKSPQADIVGKYRSGKYLFGLLGALLLLMPDRTLRVLLASKVGGAAGFGLAAGLCHILQGAAQHNRLNSDTYKRLNLGLLSFSLLGLVAVPGEAGFLPTASSAMVLSAIMFVIRVYGAAVAWKGWRLGVEPINGGSANLWREFIQGIKHGVKDLRVRDPKKALAYRNCLLLVFAGIIANIMDTIFKMRVSAV